MYEILHHDAIEKTTGWRDGMYVVVYKSREGKVYVRGLAEFLWSFVPVSGV